MTLRHAAVAGSFYPGEAETLRRDLDGYLAKGERERAWVVIVPHAGYMYSGAVAGAVYGRVENIWRSLV